MLDHMVATRSKARASEGGITILSFATNETAYLPALRESAQKQARGAQPSLRTCLSTRRGAACTNSPAATERRDAQS